LARVASGLAEEARALDALEAALDLPPEDRDGWLVTTHGNDPAFVDHVRRLLARAAGAHASLPTEPPQPARRDPPRPPPERIGPYRLTGQLGEGGMGVVYRAERDDGLFEHVVAAKLIRGARLDARAVERFAVERRALARVSHPGIARLLDGGVTPGGDPYILMDYVQGEPITDAVLRSDLDVRGVVDRVILVCEAVAAAHRRLVVHGDIKPSNVLVTPEGEVRLLDFGVARLLESEAEADGPGPVTAAYASPQRRAGEPPGTTDDVYALGALLQELLARCGPTLGEGAPASAREGPGGGCGQGDGGRPRTALWRGRRSGGRPAPLAGEATRGSAWALPTLRRATLRRPTPARRRGFGPGRGRAGGDGGRDHNAVCAGRG
jgi:serine/threonine-protein kinase